MTDTQSNPTPYGKLMATLALGIFLGALDMNILALALTPLSVEFDVGQAATVWLVTAYSAAYMVAMPIMGRLGDLLGKSKLFLAGIGLFTLGSIGCALSGWLGNDFGLLIASRVVQGLGAGGLVPVASAIIGERVEPARRGKALGVVGMCFAAASLLGPVAGGVLLDYIGWEWLFAANVPLGVLAAVMAWRNLRGDVPAAAGRIDWVGAGLLATFLGCLLMSAELIADNLKILYPIWFGASGKYLTASAVALVLFLLWERRQASPILDLGLFGRSVVRLSFALSFLYGVGMLVAMVFTPMYFHYRFDLTSLQAGLGLLPMALTAGYGSMKGGRLADRRGPRWVMARGFGVFAVGLGAMAWLAPWAPLPAILGALAVIGLGFGLCHSPLNYAVMRVTERSHHGQATGAVATHRSIGGILGATAGAFFIADAMGRIGTIMIEKVGGRLPANCTIPRTIDPNHISDMVRMLPAEVQPLVLETARQVVSTQMVGGLSQLYWIGAAALALGCLGSRWLPGPTEALEATVPVASETSVSRP